MRGVVALFLAWQDPEGGPQRRALDRVLRIGREADNDIVVSRANASRHHARAWSTDGVVYVDARESTNGVRVNGRRVQTARLAPGDTFELAGVPFRVQTAAAGMPAPGRRRPSFVLPAVVGGGLVVLALVAFGLTLAFTGGGGDGDSTANADAVSAAVARRDAAALVTAFAGDANDGTDRGVADTLLARLPAGTRIQLLASDPASERVTYELTDASGAKRRVSFRAIKSGGGETILLPAADSP
jgi:hypothetical protein